LTLRKSDRLLKPIERLKGVVVLPGNRAYLVDAPVNKRDARNNKSIGGIQETQSSKEGPRK
jgi:hypothetical protein